MTLLLREVGRFLVESGLWLAALSLIAAAIALPVLWIGRTRIDPGLVGVAILGAAALAAVAHRIGVTAIAPRVGGRPLPIVWAALGSLVTAAVVTLRHRRRDEP